jgi:hypothetical protein
MHYYNIDICIGSKIPLEPDFLWHCTFLTPIFVSVILSRCHYVRPLTAKKCTSKDACNSSTNLTQQILARLLGVIWLSL